MNKTSEKKLFKNLYFGENLALKEIISQNTHLVYQIAKKYSSIFPNFDFNDFVSEGIVGLYEAIKHYKYKKNTKFTSYAKFWIQKYIQQFITENFSMLKVPSNIISELRKILKLIKNNNDLSFKKVSKKLKINTKKINDLLNKENFLKMSVSLDSYTDNVNQTETLCEVLPEQEVTPENFYTEQEKKKMIYEYLDQISKEEREVIKLRFNIVDSKYHSIKDVAKRLNIPAQRIRDIENNALKKLKELFRKNDENTNS